MLDRRKLLPVMRRFPHPPDWKHFSVVLGLVLASLAVISWAAAHRDLAATVLLGAALLVAIWPAMSRAAQRWVDREEAAIAAEREAAEAAASAAERAAGLAALRLSYESRRRFEPLAGKVARLIHVPWTANIAPSFDQRREIGEATRAALARIGELEEADRATARRYLEPFATIEQSGLDYPAAASLDSWLIIWQRFFVTTEDRLGYRRAGGGGVGSGPV